MKNKNQIHLKCKEVIVEKKQQLLTIIERIQYSLTSESKSSAGDKHETGRAMLQLEREKLGMQLQEIEKLETSLVRINSLNNSNTIVLGSYVETNTMNYYLSVSLGEIIIENNKVFAISPQSPIGQLLLGKKAGDSISFNKKKSTIIKVM